MHCSEGQDIFKPELAAASWGLGVSPVFIKEMTAAVVTCQQRVPTIPLTLPVTSFLLLHR